ncbi:carbon-nitrogen hydrolase family protein [Actinoplanes sp. DH11]|uniref:carbon-nitrogen hydrolase family protein n=1 Tax=Actinoplanes sp. DH11 TaxID=2857011 RepID=UPI001E3A9BF6|nr:carbon-nitrogen hydrolase family protein [Actinoplanes sp. DH11]
MTAPVDVLRVGACQTPEILGNPDAALDCIQQSAAQGAGYGTNLLLFPECFLQGYLTDEEHIHRYALRLRSPEFAAVLRRLAPVEPTLVFGVIEADNGHYFNTAVVTDHGRLVGSYRKTRLMPGETVFTPGEDYPTFVLHGVRYGINICSDTQFSEPAARVAAQGATLLLVAAQNMMRRPVATRFKDLHHSIRAERARETGMWLVSSDVTGTRNDRIAYGPTSVISPQGDIVAQVPLLTTGMVVADIPAPAPPR